jgi:RNA polymerase sigma factor (sigma-70 family)
MKGIAAVRTAPPAPPPLRGPELPWDESRLVDECLRGNQAAWSALVDRYKHLVYSIPIKYGLEVDQAADVFQEVCLELLTELPRIREPRALPKWLMQVTAHKCAHLKRRASRLPFAADGGDLDQVIDVQQLSEAVLLEVEREESVRAAVANLPARCRRLVDMLFFELPPRPYKDVARSLSLSCGSIGFIRGRCLERLRRELHHLGFR